MVETPTLKNWDCSICQTQQKCQQILNQHCCQGNNGDDNHLKGLGDCSGTWCAYQEVEVKFPCQRNYVNNKKLFTRQRNYLHAIEIISLSAKLCQQQEIISMQEKLIICMPEKLFPCQRHYVNNTKFWVENVICELCNYHILCWTMVHQTSKLKTL